jgi:dienelactone hydrolase
MMFKSASGRSLAAVTATLLLAACGGTGGNPGAAPAPPTGATPPTVVIAASPASITSGASSVLTWSSNNATSCTASGAWSGTQATTGSKTVTPTTTSSYAIECSGAGGTAPAQTATVMVAGTAPPVSPAPPAPTVVLSANPTTVAVGGGSTLTWSSSNATSCAASGAWSGNESTSGIYATPALTVAATYTLACTGDGGTASVSANIMIMSTATAPTAASASTVGPYSVQTYTSGIASGAHYTVPKIYHPVGGVAPYPGALFITGLHSSYTEDPYTVVINGKTVVEADVTEWGTLLASHGFIVMFIDATNYDAAPPERATALLEAVDGLAAENTRSGSPIAGQLQPQNIAVMGHSFGAAGALYAADGNTSARIKGVVALNPVPQGPLFPNVSVPSLIMGGSGDPYITDDYLQQEYDSIPATTSKLLADFKNSAEFDSMHAIALTPLGTHTTDPVVARLVLSFLEVYLYSDIRYKAFLVNDAGLLKFAYHP